MLNLFLCLALFAHGVGHVLFLAPTVRLAEWADQTGRSWLAEPLLGDGLARLIGGAAWSIALVLFVGAAVGLYVDADWWRPAAAIGALVSLFGLIAFWSGIYTASAVFALAFDVVVLVALLWPSRTGLQVPGN